MLDIRELSFRSTQPIPAVPARRDRLRIVGAGDPLDVLYDLAFACKRRLNRWVMGDRTEAALIYEDLGQQSELWGAIREFQPKNQQPVQIELSQSEAIDLWDPRYANALFELCNYQLCHIFRGLNPRKVQAARKRIYSSEAPQIIQELAEVKSYLTFDFSRDSEGYLILSLNFGNDYQSLVSIDQLDYANFPPGQRLIHTYDGKSCEWVGGAPVSIGEPIADLGNISLIEYHQNRKNLTAATISTLDPRQPAVTVCYPPKRQSVYHLPQLLKTLYDRDRLPTQALNTIILSINERYNRAKKAIQVLNKKGFYCGDRLLFDLDLRQPPKITNFTAGAKAKNLDFGPDPQQPDRPLLYAEAWQGWGKRHLLQKPAEIRTQVLYPSAWEASMKTYMKCLRERFGEFGIVLRPAGPSRDYDPKNALSLRQVCQNLPLDSDLVFAFVPDGQDRDYDRQVNPYNTLKGQLNQAGYCSQMVTRQTMQRAGNDGRDQNVVFGILAKLGYAPWRLRSIPGTAQVFVGLDLGRKHDQTIGASAFVVDRQGQAIGWSSTALQRGETFSEASLRTILLDLFSEFSQQTGQPLRHGVVHRDGTVKISELEALKTLAAELRPHGLEQLDVVEIVKDTIVRAAVRTLDPSTQADLWTNPPRGWGWEHGPNEAIVLTTGAKQVKLNPNATPQPLLIRRRYGTTDLLTLAEQVYWLSEMHIGSTQVVRLPITTYYADRIAEVALKGLLPIEVRCEHRLYFV